MLEIFFQKSGSSTSTSRSGTPSEWKRSSLLALKLVLLKLNLFLDGLVCCVVVDLLSKMVSMSSSTNL